MQEVSVFKRENNQELIKDLAWLVSSELISAGIDINFEIILDINKIFLALLEIDLFQMIFRS